MDTNEIILDTPEPPNDLPYADFEDYRAVELLKVNNIEISEGSLISVLNNSEAVLKGASAHVLGKLGSALAVQALKQIIDISEDLVRVEAAFALVRLGIQEYRNVLRESLNHPVHAYLGPPIAAGDLARLGDFIGFPIIIKCFDIDNLIVRIIACKQIIFFLTFQGMPIENGQIVDVYALFDRALHDQQLEVQRVALVQLRELRTPEVKNILKDYISTNGDQYLKDTAQKILDRLSY